MIVSNSSPLIALARIEAGEDIPQAEQVSLTVPEVSVAP